MSQKCPVNLCRNVSNALRDSLDVEYFFGGEYDSRILMSSNVYNIYKIPPICIWTVIYRVQCTRLDIYLYNFHEKQIVFRKKKKENKIMFNGKCSPFGKIERDNRKTKPTARYLYRLSPTTIGFGNCFRNFRK